MSATEATLGYRLRQYHVGVVCWAGDAVATVDNITRLEHAISHVAGKAACSDPVFLPRDVSSAWAWLPLRTWVLSTLAGLAADDEHHARLRETLLVFLQSGGSRARSGGNAVQCAQRLVIERHAFGGQVLPQVGNGAGPGDE